MTAIELGFLPDRSKAFHNLNSRTNMMEIRGMVNTLLQTEKFGTPLAHALRVLASEYRDQRLLRAEEKAARLPAILTVPMMIFIMPCLFIQASPCPGDGARSPVREFCTRSRSRRWP